jgi:hypothetical protein
MNAMNSLLVLIVAASTTAADPQPLPAMPATPAPTIIYSESGSIPAAQEPRPRLFGRVRTFVKDRWSRMSDRYNGNTPANQVVSGPATTSVVVTPAPTSPAVAAPAARMPVGTRAVRSDSSAEPPLADPSPTTPTTVRPPS